MRVDGTFCEPRDNLCLKMKYMTRTLIWSWVWTIAEQSIRDRIAARIDIPGSVGRAFYVQMRQRCQGLAVRRAT